MCDRKLLWENLGTRCRLFLNGKVIWENPGEIGFFGIKLRKQAYEDRLIERLERRQTKMKMTNCRDCEFLVRSDFHCWPVDTPIEDLGSFCPKKVGAEEFRDRCENYIPPGKMSDKKSACLAHIGTGRVPECFVESISELFRLDGCNHFELKKEKES